MRVVCRVVPSIVSLKLLPTMSPLRCLFLSTVLLAMITNEGATSNLPSLLNPLGFLQQAGQNVMATLMRSTQPNPTPATARDPRPIFLYKDSKNPDMADRVAALVSNSLGNGDSKDPKRPQQKQQQQQSGGGLFGGFMRLLGLDSTRLGAIAINAFVYVSEMIAATLTRMGPPNAAGKRDSDSPGGSVFSWLLDKPGPKVAEALRLAQNRELPEVLIGLVHGRAKRSIEEDYEVSTWCLQRLMCHLAPVLWGMQQTVEDALAGDADPNKKEGPLTVLWRYLPTRDKLREQGDKCEERFPECRLNI